MTGWTIRNIYHDQTSFMLPGWARCFLVAFWNASGCWYASEFEHRCCPCLFARTYQPSLLAMVQ